MKDLVSKIMSVIGLAKGKKPIVLILSIAAVLVLYYAASKGWVTGEVVSIEQIVDGISSAFASDSAKAIVDSVALPVDSLAVEVVDSIAHQ